MLRVEQASAEARCTLPCQCTAAYVSLSKGPASISLHELSNDRPAATTCHLAWSSVAVKAQDGGPTPDDPAAKPVAAASLMRWSWFERWCSVRTVLERFVGVDSSLKPCSVQSLTAKPMMWLGLGMLCNPVLLQPLV